MLVERILKPLKNPSLGDGDSKLQGRTATTIRTWKCVCYQCADAVGRTTHIAAGNSAADMMDAMGSSNKQTTPETVLVQKSEEIVDRFLDAIWMERGLSPNTLKTRIRREGWNK